MFAHVNNKYLLKIILCLFGYNTLYAQTRPDCYLVFFTDKNNSPYSLNNPQQYLSLRAIERRQKQQITLKENDLPVNPAYINAVLSTGNVTLKLKSKWFNAITIQTTDSNALQLISQLPFVSSVRSVQTTNQHPRNTKELFFNTPKEQLQIQSDFCNEYGQACNQINMLNGISLHKLGYTGKGMIIAQMDSGYPDVLNMQCFANMLQENRLLCYYDFVDLETDVFNNPSSHGTLVLSTMAAKLPGQYIGTAPDASYMLFVTEDAPVEYIIEEDNWVAAAEFADSAGADIINTSLGYTTFDDSTQNHTYADMNGKTARISIASTIAASKGILCVTSAGNQGNSPWFYISAPADADSILSVGAVNQHGVYAAFSSKGPTSDGRIKPDVAAQGNNAVFIWPGGNIATGNGTSFSSPILAGMAASLWQAHPDKTNLQIIEAIKQSASQYNHPDTLIGYGIPDFYKAHRILSGLNTNYYDFNLINIFPNPFTDRFNIELLAGEETQIEFILYDYAGRIIWSKTHPLTPNKNNLLTIYDTNPPLSKGLYYLFCKSSQNTRVLKLVKQ